MCTFAHASVFDIQKHIRINHNNNKEIRIEIILFFSTFHDGTLLKPSNIEKDDIVARGQLRVRVEEIERAKKKRSGDEQREDMTDGYMPKKIKKTSEKRVRRESEDEFGSQLSLPPPNQTLHLLKSRQHKPRSMPPNFKPRSIPSRSLKPLSALLPKPLNLQPCRSLNQQLCVPLNTGGDVDNIESDSGNDTDPPMPPPNQPTRLQRPKICPTKDGNLGFSTTDSLSHMDKARTSSDDFQVTEFGLTTSQKNFVFAAFQKLTQTERIAVLEMPLEGLVHKLKDLATKKPKN